MSVLAYKTRGNSSPAGKPRIYFTCHPNDRSRFFEKLCNDILKAHDCAVYYTNSPEAIDDENRDIDLGRMNLFVVPVSFRLLSEPDHMVERDLAFAKSERIPILPFMMESGIDTLYSRPENFGERQYLNPYSTDMTEIDYHEKLKKYLDSVLIGDEMVQRIRAAFDAYIFLSYRKKDRRYANELMRLIHKNPEFQDIAIWYDEFLTPGESFEENIKEALENSRLFALLITPNLLEETNGAPNFVVKEEYPAAKRAGLDIIPAEMVPTDRGELDRKFDSLPECIDPQEETLLRDTLIKALSRFAITSNDRNSTHSFLIGLAYLEGIDVECDAKRALSLIKSAAEADLPEAMKKLYNMYSDGEGVPLDYNESISWAKRLVGYCLREHGEDHTDTLSALDSLATACFKSGKYKEAAEYEEKVYNIRRRLLGEEHRDTLSALANLAADHACLGEFKKSLELNMRSYELCCNVLGEEAPETLTVLNNLAMIYERVGDNAKALKAAKQAYSLQCKLLGTDHPDTLTSLGNLSFIYNLLGDYKKSIALGEKAYEQLCNIGRERHPNALALLNNLSWSYDRIGDYKKHSRSESAFTMPNVSSLAKSIQARFRLSILFPISISISKITKKHLSRKTKYFYCVTNIWERVTAKPYLHLETSPIFILFSENMTKRQK